MADLLGLIRFSDFLSMVLSCSSTNLGRFVFLLRSQTFSIHCMKSCPVSTAASSPTPFKIYVSDIASKDSNGNWLFCLQARNSSATAACPANTYSNLFVFPS